MRTLIVGSIEFDAAEEEKSRWKAACFEIGKALAEAGHSLVVGSDTENTADHFVVYGANSATSKRTKVLVNRPEADVLEPGPDRTPFAKAQSEKKLQRIDFNYNRERGHWSANRVSQILASDAVIAIGGASGTLQTGYSAPLLGRPVLVIPHFGGAATKLWSQFAPDYDRAGLKEKAAHLREEWTDSHAKLAVEVLQGLLRSNPYKRKTSTRQLFVLAAVLLAGWGIVFAYPIEHGMATFLILLLISALIGSTLRISLRELSSLSTPDYSQRITTEFTSGLLLAFALALIYFTGGLAITGDFKFAKQLQTDADFFRVSIAMSLLGLGAALLVERASERVVRFLENVVGKHR